MFDRYDTITRFTMGLARRMREEKNAEWLKLFMRTDTRFKSKRAGMVPLTAAELEAIVADGA